MFKIVAYNCLLMMGGDYLASETCILACKNYDSLMEGISKGTVKLSDSVIEEYKAILGNVSEKCSDLKNLKKFIKKVKADKNDVMHYWEGLIMENYMLIAVNYSGNQEHLKKLCDGDYLKYVG